MGAKGKMKKFFAGSKKKKEEASPLMADDSAKSSATAASTRFEVENDKEREARNKERDERRKLREERLADSKASTSSRSKSTKKKSKPKITQEEQDARDAKLGCCHSFQKIIVKIVHVIDAAIGLTFLIYGLLINNFENPAVDAVISSIAFGATMLFTSIMGAIGFYTKMCWRFGLILSAYTAPFITLFYVFIIIALLSSGDIYFSYLEEHMDVMYLDQNEIDTVKQILPFFYIALASLATIEVIRFMVLRKLQAELVRSDSASQRISAREREASSRSNLSEPLIGDEGV